MSVFFDEFSPTLVVGGTYSGQIVLWDTRAKTTPIQHTPLSSVGHTHPVYSMDIVGSKNAHNLVTVSTDGKLCVWNLENLLQPLVSVDMNFHILIFRLGSFRIAQQTVKTSDSHGAGSCHFSRVSGSGSKFVFRRL